MGAVISYMAWLLARGIYKTWIGNSLGALGSADNALNLGIGV